MSTNAKFIVFAVVLAAVAIFDGKSTARADAGHTHADDEHTEMLEAMRDMHAGHAHHHDFEAMEDISPEDMHRTMDFMVDIGLVLPPMDSERGKTAFMEKGCIVCHSINGVGGAIGPPLNATDMPVPMNAFEFAARMWRGAPAMVQMQEELFGEAIALNGEELADIVAFVHDEALQEQLTAADIPERFRSMIVR
ncbi:hypothetical protein DEA8626_01224 [Defluviimonas aquaemixtae]|uniref:Cytochrome c domain-containing protein n=1 Tax=Albidovulum aquaemixtae TaxID=1542388 RepID=A0A2R8B506_9RHOB|nr:cytochrome c [Defluviimonas aquaemixtae]SPH17698.1 hypothetical protein DEA8626_01224 [Defluviimonas aquaemixtae]